MHYSRKQEQKSRPHSKWHIVLVVEQLSECCLSRDPITSKEGGKQWLVADPAATLPRAIIARLNS